MKKAFYLLAVLFFLLIYTNNLKANEENNSSFSSSPQDSIDPNDFKTQVAKFVWKSTGRKIKFNGTLEVKIFPKVGILAQDIIFMNAEGFEPPQMASVKEIFIGINVLPLIKKELQINSIILDGLEFNYVINKDNVSNLADIRAWKAQAEKPDSNDPDITKEVKKPLNFYFKNTDISKITITNMKLSYTNHATNKKIIAGPVNIATGKFAPNKPLDLIINATVDSTKPNFKGVFDINANIDAKFNKDMKIQTFKISENFKTSIINRADNYTIDAEGNTKLLFDNSTRKVTLSAFNSVAKASVGTMQKLSINADSADYYINTGTFNIENLMLKRGETVFVINADGENLKTEPNIRLNAKLNEHSLQEFIKNMQVKTTEKSTLNSTAKISGEIDIKYNDRTVYIDQLTINSDEDQLKAVITADYREKRPVIKSNIHINSLDISKYLALVPNKKRENKGRSQPTAISIDLSKTPHIETTVTADKITYRNMPINDIKLSLNVEDNVLNIKNLSANLSGGEIKLYGKLIGDPKRTRADLNATISTVNIRKIVAVIKQKPENQQIPKNVSLSMTSLLADNVITIKDISLSADDALAKGTAAVDLRTKPAIHFQVDGENINLNPFFGIDMTNKKPMTINFSGLSFSIDGHIASKSLKYYNYIFTNLTTDLSIDNSSAKISNLKADTLGGSIAADIKFQHSGNSLLSDYIIKVNKMRTEEITTTFAPGAKPFISAYLTADMKLSSVGNNVIAILSAISGDATFRISDAMINGFSIDKDSAAHLDKLELFGETKHTKVNDITGTAIIKNGIVSTNSIALSSDNITSYVSGSFNLTNMRLGYNAMINVENVETPLAISGNFYKPVFAINESIVLDALKSSAEAEYAAKYQALFDKVMKRVRSNLKKM